MSSSVPALSRGPTKPPVVQPGSGNAIIINPCQRLNPMLECIRNVNKEFGDIVPDFQLGKTTCALFLSLKYHRLHPEYIHQRIQRLGQLYSLRLLILMCDISEHLEPIRELTKICLVNNITIIVCWSNEEAGMYLATYKAFEHKPPDLIKERVDKEYNAMLRAALTSINRVNKTDVETLRTTFGSFARIAHTTPEELRRLPGFGQVKVRRVTDAFDKPFRNKATSAIPAQTQAEILLDEQEIMEEGAQGLLIEERQPERRTKGTTEEGEASQDSVASTIIAATQSSIGSTSISSSKHIHNFGSAADAQPPSVHPLAYDSTYAPTERKTREPSPVWDIELDLNLPEENELNPREQKNSKASEEGDAVDLRLAKKARNIGSEDEEGSGQRAGGDIKTNDGKRRPKGKIDGLPEIRPRERSPSPVWDIELDLNADDL